MDGQQVLMELRDWPQIPVLVQLARHAGRVVAQQQLLKDIWGPSHGEGSH